MAACCSDATLSRRLPAMASIAGHRSRRQGPRLFEGPVLFRRSRMTIVEFIALVWLIVKLAPLARSFFESPSRGRERVRA